MYTPLHDAVRGGILAVVELSDKVETVQLLLQAGADINAQEQFAQKNTALHDACQLGRTECAKELLIGGADPAIRNGDGKLASEMIPYSYDGDGVWGEKRAEEMRLLFKEC